MRPRSIERGNLFEMTEELKNDLLQ